MKIEIYLNPDATIATIKADEVCVSLQLHLIEDVYEMLRSHLRHLEKNPTELKEHKQFGSTVKQYDGSHADVVLNREKLNLTAITNSQSLLDEIEKRMKDEMSTE